jgi:hypothetical protein
MKNTSNLYNKDRKPVTWDLRYEFSFYMLFINFLSKFDFHQEKVKWKGYFKIFEYLKLF